jgi:DNA-binding transcriptional MerR regulator
MPTGLGQQRRTPRTRVAVPPKRFKIGEVMRYTGLSRQTLHNYTVMGLITERERTESGHRLYGEEVFGRLRRLEELKGRMTLLEIRQLFESEGPDR